jgi:hypothetical protein
MYVWMGRLRSLLAINDSFSIDSILSQITHFTRIKAPLQLFLKTECLYYIIGKYKNRLRELSSSSALVSPDRQMFFCKKSRSLTFIAEGYLTRGARRWSWTILEVAFYDFL